MASVMEEELGEDTDLPMMLNKTVLEAEQQEKVCSDRLMSLTGCADAQAKADAQEAVQDQFVPHNVQVPSK